MFFKYLLESFCYKQLRKFFVGMLLLVRHNVFYNEVLGKATILT